MRHWVSRFARLVLCLPAASIAIEAAVFAQSGLPAATPAVTTQAAGVATDAIKMAVSRVIDSGRSLELSGRWADALTHYEEALHQYNIVNIHYHRQLPHSNSLQ